MKKLLIILIYLPMIGWGQIDKEKCTYTILAKYNGLELLMATHYQMNLLLCGNCHTYNMDDYKWKSISNWNKKGSKALTLSYYADINYDKDEMEYYTVSEEVTQLKMGEIYWIELEFSEYNSIDMNNVFLNNDLGSDFVSAKKATHNEITEYFFINPAAEEDYSDW